MKTETLKPIVGAPRSHSCCRTIQVFEQKLSALAPLMGGRALDVGCGDGSFTEALTGGYDEVHGIDVQKEWLDRFRARCDGDSRFHIHEMSASEMTFPDNFFDTIISVETIEHIPDLEGAAREMARVLKSGGDLVLTCPNRWFPFENHGVRWRGREISRRIPLLTYLPPLHDRFSLARVFTVRRLKQIFQPQGFVLRGVDYAWPTFEHGGNSLQKYLRGLFGVMRVLERSPLRMFGTSILTHFVKR
jgi:SAM-dependent methyltransferase